jgi:SAM-dependent methyltransferase
MTGGLRSFYEDPATPVRSGGERARRQIDMLLGIARRRGGVLQAVDVGCGDGLWTAAARDACTDAADVAVRFVGLDWSMAALAAARGRGLPVARASVDQPGLPLASGSVDIVIMSEFIEHLVDPDVALDEAVRVLVPGGTLLLSTPNLAAWFNRGLLLAGVQPVFSEVSLRGIYGRPGREVVGHLHLFTKRALVELLDAHGFRDVTVVGGRYHDVPRPLRPVDRLMTLMPAWSSILLAAARAPAEHEVSPSPAPDAAPSRQPPSSPSTRTGRRDRRRP